MIYLADAIALAFCAFHWNRNGWGNTACILAISALAVVSAAGSYPFVASVIKF